MELEGFSVDTKTKTTKNSYIVYFKFRNVLREFGFRARKDEKFLVKFKIDYSSCKNIRVETRFVDSFNERFPLLINSPETLFAQKITALKFRPYQKGRDFYDLIRFLSQKNVEPNYKLLKEKGVKVKNRAELKKEMKKIIAKLDLKQAAKEAERFLFYPEKAKWIADFEKYLESF